MSKIKALTVFAVLLFVILLLPPAQSAGAYSLPFGNSTVFQTWYEQRYNRSHVNPSPQPAPEPSPVPEPSPQPTPPQQPSSSSLLKDWFESRYGRSYQAPTPYQPAPAPTPQPDPPASPAPSPQPQPIPGPVDGLTPEEQQMVDWINQERTERGLNPLTVNMKLVELARLKSKDIIENNYFSHTSPTYGSPYEMEKAAGISARIMGGENIAKAASIGIAHMRFMASEGHRFNILYPDYDEVGVGVVHYQYGVTVTQLFIGD